MTDKYKLDGKNVVPCSDPIEEWGRWFETANRKVAQDMIGDVRVSTVFIGLDHRFLGEEGPPLVFETMIFGGPHEDYQIRSCTWDEAEAQHAEAIKLVRSSLN